MAYTTIDKPSDYFNTKLYTGDGNSTQSISSVGFQPDWVWQKRRNSASNHELTDVVRGINSTLVTNNSDAQDTGTNKLQSFDSDGFTVGGSSTQNASGGTYASWNWKAGGTAASNTNGSITSSVSANQDAGFSIVSYTGTGANATVGHGLSSVPKMVIVKDRDNGTYAWHVYHVGVGATKTIYLNLTNTPDTNSIYWNNTAPTSSVFSVGTSVTTNNSGDNFIAYCFAEKQGYSKFGSWTGNGNADGPFIFTGFLPSLIIGKNVSRVEDWFMLDNKRDTFNPVDERLQPNSSGAESTVTTLGIDFCANGFKLRGATNQYNPSGETMIYMAFAENPFTTSTGVPATAR